MASKNFQRYLIVALLIVLPVAVFWRAQEHQFISGWDDKLNIQENPFLNPVTLPKVFYFWTQPHEGLYIPLTYTVWAGVAKLNQLRSPARGTALDPRPFHRLNIVLHVLSGLVVLAILARLTDKDWAACAGALFFALHPVQVEPVAWATGTKDLLSGFFSLVAVWQYLCYAVAKQQPSVRRQISSANGRGHYATALAAFVLALIAKPGAVAVPLVLWTIDYWLLKRPARQSLLALAPWALLAAPVILINKLVQPDELAGFVAPLWARPLIAGDAIAYYLYKLAYPLWLTPDYGRHSEKLLREGWIYLTFLIPLVLALWLWSTRKKLPWLVASAGVFGAALLPVSGLIPFAFQFMSTGADRYLYFSLLGAALGVASALGRAERRWQPVVIGGCLLIVGALALRSSSQLQYWRDPVTLFSHVLAGNPNSWMAHNNLGNLEAAQGNLAAAMAHFDLALRANPRHAETYNNIANVHVEKGELEKAVQSYQTSLAIEPRLPLSHNNLGLALIRLGRIDEAMDHYRLALTANPTYAEAYDNLASAWFAKGRVDDAIRHYRQAVAIKPAFAKAHYNLALALVKRGDLAGAGAHYQIALEIDPRFVEAHGNLSGILLQRGDIQGALSHAREAVKLAPQATVNRLNLGNILLSQGRQEEAIAEFQAALRMDPDLAEAHEGLGRAREAQGKTREAVMHYQRTVELMKQRARLAQAR